jgi:hypothetical protein
MNARNTPTPLITAKKLVNSRPTVALIERPTARGQSDRPSWGNSTPNSEELGISR